MSMQAVVVHEPGGPEVLRLEQRPIPEPRPGWVLVHVRAFGLNRSELITRAGGSGDAVRFPRVLGIECGTWKRTSPPARSSGLRRWADAGRAAWAWWAIHHPATGVSQLAAGTCWVMQWMLPPPSRISRAGTPTIWRSGKHSPSTRAAVSS
jgi:hypothetical protein